MKLGLGTAQFGINYGVANSRGQVSKQGVIDILRLAESAGICLIDTAVSYGSAEKTLGIIGISGWSCITKLPPMPYGELNPKKWVESQIKESLKRLNLTNFSAVLTHQSDDMLGSNSQEYLHGLQEMKNQGYIKDIGYSIYCPSVLEELTEVFWPNVIQTPYNVFDQRIKTSGWLDKLTVRGTKVHARSVFLQGLLLMPEDLAIEKKPDAIDYIRRLNHFSKNINISKLSLALGFISNIAEVDHIIVGVTSRSQLNEVIEAYGCEIDPSALRELSVTDDRVTDPRFWA